MGLIAGIRTSITNVTDRLFADATPKRIGIYGPPNAGKCVAPDETVRLADGTQRRIADIFDEVVGTETDPVDISDEPHETWVECNEVQLHVPAVADGVTPVLGRVSHVFRQQYQGPLYRVTTEDDRSVRVSPDHPFITGTEAAPDAVRAADLTPGSRLATLPAAVGPTSESKHRPPVATDGGSRGSTADSVAGVDRGRRSAAQWDQVASIDRLSYDGYIYDLTVADHHTFTTGDGLVVHNTTLANRITQDWTGEGIGAESHVPHETRRAHQKENVEIERNGSSVTIDVVDTPGVATKVDYEEFLEFDLEEEDAIERSREATEGVAEAMHWLREDVDGVIYVLDSAEDPFTQVNTMLIGIIESRDLPVLIFANKIDLDDSSVQRIENAFPQHETVPLSALEGENMDEVYDKIATYFG